MLRKNWDFTFRFTLLIAVYATLGCSGWGDMTNSGEGSQDICSVPSQPMYVASETDKYVVNGESLRNIGRGHYRFPSSATKGSSFAFKFFANPGQKFSYGTTVTTGTGIRWQVSISECPGDFSVPSSCQAAGVEVSHVNVAAAPYSTEPRSSSCNIESNKPYYLNVRLPVERADCAGSCDFYVEGLGTTNYLWDE